MPTHAGPNTLGEEHLVFSYDLTDTVNSYVGAPTTNICTGDNYSIYNSGATNSRNQTFPLPPVVGYEVVRVAADTPGTYGQSILWTATYSSTPTTTTNSVYAWLASGTYVQVGQHWHPWNFGSPKYIEKGKWVRISETYAINEGGSYSQAAMVYSTDGVAYFCMPQYELKPYLTPFVGFSQTRSATQGLLPLIGNSTINLTNVSFDSNAQIVFDGTDDTISVPSYSAIELVDNVSIEYVYMRLSTDSILDIIANKYHNTGWELFCQTGNTFALAGRNGDGTYYSTTNAAYTIQNNTYYHLVAIKEGLSWRLYVNGELYASLTANSIGTWSNTGILQIGGEGAGYFPNMKLPVLKIYNRVLTASEISRNFNAIKSRFNI